MQVTTLLKADEIRRRVAELSQQINRDFEGKPLVVVGVLKGAFVFMADLVRSLKGPVTCDFLRMESYDAEGKSSGSVRLEFDLTQPVEGKHVLLIEDIVDTGLTAAVLIKHLQEKRPASLRLCALLHKPAEKVHVNIDYLGFEIPNVYVVGYGLDLNGEHRHLPYLGQVNLPPSER